MALDNLSLKLCYRSDRDNMINDFYNPILGESKEYKRAVGYFSTGSLLLLDKGLEKLIEQNGKILLIASPQLSKSDIEEINNGYEKRELILKRVITDSVFLPENEEELTKLSKIERLIALNILDIKIAYKQNGGIFHEKIGIVRDTKNNKVAFTGSLNETNNAYNNNFESIDLYFSWDERDSTRVESKESDFDRLWNDETDGLEVYDFTKAIHNKLLEYISTGLLEPLDEDEDDEILLEPGIPKKIKIRNYQLEAYNAWKDNNYKGILEMATGTGKTITACYSLVNLYKELIKEKKKQVVIVLAPYKHLVEQWNNELMCFGYSPLKIYSETNWSSVINRQVSRLNLDRNKHHLSMIITNDSFKTNRFQEILLRLQERFEVVIVADEAHNVGADTMLSVLPQKVKYRLGLTATPVRHNDEEGTKKLIQYFSKIIFQFSLKDAIDKGFLTKYYYYPHVVYLDNEESKRYYDLIDEFSGYPLEKLKRIAFSNQNLKEVIRMSYQIADGSINKFIKFKECISQFSDTYYNLVYCSSVDINNGENKLPIKQISAVTAYLGNELRMKVHTFTAEEENSLRQKLLSRFSKGDDLQSLIAIKCLDEGVDVPATRRAFILSSTTNEKQFVQRRGRVLRKAEGKDFAEIYDFITLPKNLEELDDVTDTELFLVAKEYKRIKEFSKLAINEEVGLELLDKILTKYPNIEEGVTHE